MQEHFLGNIVLFTFAVLLTDEFSHALRDVHVQMPHAVNRGEKVTLKCFYDIEGDNLYSVKWYKGRREFYRFTPKENPPMKIFQFPGVKIDRYASNESQLVLEAVTMTTAGKYSCEVSADAPSFHTLIAAGELEIVEKPHKGPLIIGIRSRYRIGELLRGNCTSRHSKPAANLTWTVNNEEIQSSYKRHYKILRDVRNTLETSVLGIQFVVMEHHFENGKIKLRCTAEIHNIYWKSTEKVIMQDNLHHDNYDDIDSENSINVIRPGNVDTYDQYALHDSRLVHTTDNYLTQLQEFLFQFVPSSSSDPHSAWATSGAEVTVSSLTQNSVLKLIFATFCICQYLLEFLINTSHWTYKRKLFQHKCETC